MVPGLGFARISVDLEGPRPWICKYFGGSGGSQAYDSEGFQWIWRVTGLGFERISQSASCIKVEGVGSRSGSL